MPTLQIELACVLLGNGEGDMRKITLFAAAVAVFVLIGIDAWLCVRTFPDGAIASPVENARVTMTGAKGLPTSHYDDYDIVVY
jgi:hypothetical protein